MGKTSTSTRLLLLVQVGEHWPLNGTDASLKTRIMSLFYRLLVSSRTFFVGVAVTLCTCMCMLLLLLLLLLLLYVHVSRLG